MREVFGDIWDFDCNVRCIPTNGFVKKNGQAVMGAGLARQAALRYPDLPYILGTMIGMGGNRIYQLRHDLMSFPVKRVWWEEANKLIILDSTEQLLTLADKISSWKTIALPRVGCGNGKLNWGQDVRPILDALLDDRFVIVDNAE